MSSMHPVNQSVSPEPIDNLSIQPANIENPEFLQRTSATQECGQKLIAEISQNSQKGPPTDSDDFDLAPFGDALSFVAQTAEGEQLEHEGEQIGDKGEQVEDEGKRLEEKGKRLEEKGKQLEGKGTEKVVQGDVQRLESIEEVMESSKLIDHVVVISDIQDDRVAVVEGKALGSSHLNKAFQNNQVAVIHLDKLYVHPSAGLTHGQKVTLSDGRTLTVQHFASDLWEKLSNAVMNYITQLSKKDKDDDVEKAKKEQHTSPDKVSTIPKHHSSKKEKVQDKERRWDIKVVDRSDSPEKQIEKAVLGARTLEHLFIVLDQIIVKHIQRVKDQNERYDNHQREVFLDTLRSDKNVRHMPQALFGHA